MSNKGAVPDAWDDDWANGAKKPEATMPPTVTRLTKAERKAQHQELQMQLWDTAENPGRNHWLENQGVVPLKQELKPQVTLLSRKPATKIAKKSDLGEDEGDDSEEEARKKREVDFEERQKKAKLDREEKPKKYAEARERIMGTSTPGSPAATSRESSQARDTRNPRHRVNGNKASRPTSADQSPAPGAIGTLSPTAQLFDPNDAARWIPKSSTPTLSGPTRQPRGPDGSSGFGFTGRGSQAHV
ncbi:hypothetical protein LTR08_006454 [Meristemomyces frigidus]|nr:hypothetical protein LTR08_006454 [Meristemomyces frigidus]